MSLIRNIGEHITSIMERDPAPKSRLEVLLCYPGLHAVWIYRLTHQLYKARLFLVARLISQWARAVVGDDVTIYQGVTLGGTGKDKGKRHPTIRNGVVIGAGAQVLGNITVGENSRVGAASVMIDDVPDNSTIVGVPGHIIFRNGKRVVITNPREIRDPLSDALHEVVQRVEKLEGR